MLKQQSSSAITEDERNKRISMLLNQQNAKCYICGKEINLALEKVDLDHIRSRVSGGIDDINNLAVTHDKCNRSKGSRDLELQRILYRFQEHVKKYTDTVGVETSRNFTVGDDLQEIIPERREVTVAVEKDERIFRAVGYFCVLCESRAPLHGGENHCPICDGPRETRPGGDEDRAPCSFCGFVNYWTPPVGVPRGKIPAGEIVCYRHFKNPT